MTQFAKDQWERARRAMNSARMLIESDPDSAASRAYYSAFHAATAYFALNDRGFRRHTALRAAVHRDLVRAGLLPASFGNDFDQLVQLRDAGDYGDTSVSAENAKGAVAKAEAVLAALEPLVKALLQDSP